MIGAVLDHFAGALVAAGLGADRVLRGAAALAQTKLLPRAVLHFRSTEEELRRDGTWVGWVDGDGVRAHRRRLWRREMELLVQLDAATHEQAEELLTKTLAAAGTGFVGPDGMWIGLGPIAAARDEDKAQATQVVNAAALVTCIGGIYQDTSAHKATDVALTGQFAQEL